MRSPVQDYLEDIVRQCAGTDGEVASYIPELAAADPDRFALALATVDGHVYTVGDAELRYSIQSISKPFTYALALAEHGAEAVDAKVDVEPSGDAFNEISLAADTGRPRNPMINAGAITAASLVPGDTLDDRIERVRAFYSACAGRELGLDESVWRSELGSAHRNRAIAHMLREFDVVEDDPDETVDLYVRQCSLSVDTRDLALMAATLANGGVQPRTGERVLDTHVNERVLSVMATCGMYDAAGDWLSSVGMPAKSGVSGGIIAVLPGQVGLAVFSPRLDPHGNSARGVRLCERMSRDMEMHLMHVGRGARTALRASYSLTGVASRRRRTEADTEVLDGVRDRAMVYELHGDLLFAEAELVVRRVVDDAPEVAVVDARRVDDVTAVARTTLLGLRAMLREAGSSTVVVDPRDVLPDPDPADDSHGRAATAYFHDLDSAVVWAEDELLHRHGGSPDDEGDQLVREHPLLRDLPDDARIAVEAELQRRRYAADEVVLEAGGGFSGVHVIVRGEAVATIDGPDGRPHVLVTMSPGTSFGELALGTDDVQETRISARTELELLVLPAEAIERIASAQPEVGVQVWRAMTRDAYRVADRALRAAGTIG